MRVGKWRTMFVLLCIAAGVSAVVSLQTLGAMIEDVLTGNLQELNRGDMRLRVESDEPSDIDLGKERGHLVVSNTVREVLTVDGIQAVTDWIQERDPDAQINYRQIFPRDFTAGFGIAKVGELVENVPGILVNIDNYPFYGEIRTLEGDLIQEAMQEPTDLIISDNAADKYGFEVGDEVHIGGSEETFVIKGIVDVETETLSNPESAFLGFYYIDHSAIPLFSSYDKDLVTESGDGNRYALEVFVKLTDTNRTEVNEFAEQLQDEFPYIAVRTTADLQEFNSTLFNALDQLLLIMGLVSLLIGGIGIIQTMMVIVARRTTEIAILKTVGLKAGQITILFFIEALILGIAGSAIGIPVGLLLALGLEYVAEIFFAQNLSWVLSLTAIWRGFVLGVVITGVFGLLPTLIAGQVRPGRILRPSETQMPGASISRTLLALVVVFLVLGVISWSILGGGISGNPQDALVSVLSIGLAVGVAIGIGTAALAAGTPPAYKSKDELERSSRTIRRVFLVFGILVQTVLEGVLFFALGIILIVIIFERITTENTVSALIIAILIGLYLSVQSLRKQPAVPVTLGAVLLGFVGGILAGIVVGSIIGLPAFFLLSETALWEFIIDLSSNIVLIEISFVLLGVVAGVLWLLVALSTNIPSFGIPDIKLTLRTLSESRNRVSTTVLALVIGVLALSLILMLTQAIRGLLSFSLEESAGGNVFIFVSPGENWLETADTVSGTIEAVDGVESYTIATNYVVDFVEVVKPDGTRLTREDLMTNIQDELDEQGRNARDFRELLDYTLNFVDGRSVTQAGALPNYEFINGSRQLSKADAGKRRIVVRGNQAVMLGGIEAGDILVFDFPNAARDNGPPARLKFEVVGITEEPLGGVNSAGSNPIYAPLDAFGDIRPDTMGAVVDIDEGNIRQLRRQLAQDVPQAFVFEISQLNQLIDESINRFTTLPIIVAVLAVVVAGVVIANSVILTTMERQREIGIMKAVGLQRERVLGMLLFENGLMGLLGGTIGVGASVLLLIFLWAQLFEGDLSDAVPLDIALLLMVACVGISLLASVAIAWRASGEKPLNVLRYE
ncbi:MAG: ABC transporter permease [Chloroflexi bacterium]|nr:ABC transporter permease [Chloroflexota bacterium]